MKGTAMDFNVKDLSPELVEKAKSCKSTEELVELAKSEGVELSDEQLEAISGGESKWDVMTGCHGEACIGFVE